MNIENLANAFTKKSGIQQSVASAIISIVIQYVIQYAATSGGGGKGGIRNVMSILSNLGGGNLTAEHPLVKQVQEKTGLEDSQQAAQYTEKAVNFIKQEADVNPEGVESLFGNILGSATGVSTADVGEKPKKGLGGLLKGFFGSK